MCVVCVCAAHTNSLVADDFVWTRDFLGSRDVGLYDMNIGHRVQSGHTIAYCAHCQHVSRTDVTL